MKLLITEQQLKTITEISDRIREQIDIIYQDKNLICFVPKTQEASKIYGSNANWCQRHKTGFEMWSERGLLIRFLFRGGRKIRTTYFFKHQQVPTQRYYWANENGYHVLFGETTNPFDAVNKEGRIRQTEQDIIDHIHMIPDECKRRVLEFIKEHEEGYDYCYKGEEYYTKKETIIKNNLELIQRKYQKYIDYIKSFENNFVQLFIDNDGKYTFNYGIKMGDWNDDYDMFDTINSNDIKEFNQNVYNELVKILTFIKQKREQ